MNTFHASSKNGTFLYSAVSSPSDRSNRLTLRTLADLFILTNYSLKNIHSNLSQLSVVRCSFMELSELGYHGENENARVLKRLLPQTRSGSIAELHFLIVLSCSMYLYTFVFYYKFSSWNLYIIELTVWLAVWQLTPRTADVTVTKIAGYVRVRILMHR